MSYNPLISVVIPAYNASEFIAQCVENIQFQTYKHIEVLVVDDGSTDDTALIAKSYDVKVISQPNTGVSAARNRGITEAVGDYIHFMDADDLINDCFYECMISAATRNQADMVCCNVIQEKNLASSHIFKARFLATNPEDKMVLARVGEEGYAVKYLFKRNFLVHHSLLFNEKISVGEDIIFSLQAVYLANRLISVNNAYYHYKYRQGSTLGRFNRIAKAKRKKELSPVRDFIVEFQKLHSLKNIGINQGVKMEYRIFGICLFHKKKSIHGTIKWYLFGVCILRRKIIYN